MVRVLAGLIIALHAASAIAQSTQPAGLSKQDSVYISGAVSRPGVYPHQDRMTPLDLIKLAGGLLPLADDRLLIVSGTEKDPAGKPVARFVSIHDLKNATPEKPQLELKSGDQLIVRAAK